MKKRILFSYVIAFSLLLANISFAGYTTPVQDFFGDNGYGIVSQQAEEIVTPDNTIEASVAKISSPLQGSQEIVHEDTIELFEDTTSLDDDNQDVGGEERQEVNDFVDALEQELAS